MPGILTGWVSWSPFVEPLSTSRRVVRVQPIHSELATKGELPPPGFDWRTERESFRITLDELGIDSADLVGWSGGGRALIEFAAQYPVRVRTLTLIEPAAYWALEQAGIDDPSMMWDVGLSRRIAGRPVTDDELVEFLGRAGMGGADVRDDPRWPLWMQNRNALASDLALAYPQRRLVDLKAFDRPVLLVVGSDTAPWLKKVIDIASETYANADVLELPGGHACHLENPEQFLAALQNHVGGA